MGMPQETPLIVPLKPGGLFLPQHIVVLLEIPLEESQSLRFFTHLHDGADIVVADRVVIDIFKPLLQPPQLPENILGRLEVFLGQGGVPEPFIARFA